MSVGVASVDGRVRRSQCQPGNRRGPARGYENDFSVTADGQLRCGVCGQSHSPRGATVELTSRFEGMSDPGEEAVIFGLRCLHCDARGVLVAAYGPSASVEDAAVVAALGESR